MNLTMKEVIEAKNSAYSKKDGKRNVDLNNLTVAECAAILVTPDGMGSQIKLDVLNMLIKER